MSLSNIRYYHSLVNFLKKIKLLLPRTKAPSHFNILPFPLFQPINNADFIVPVEIDGTIHQVYVLKRPHVDEFLVRMGELFECVLFTASLAKVRSTMMRAFLTAFSFFICKNIHIFNF